MPPPPNFDLCGNIQGVYFDFYVIRLEIAQGSVLPCLNDTLDYHLIFAVVKSKIYKGDAITIFFNVPMWPLFQKNTFEKKMLTKSDKPSSGYKQNFTVGM